MEQVKPSMEPALELESIIENILVSSVTIYESSTQSHCYSKVSSWSLLG